MHDIEHELRRLVRTGRPGAFVYIEDADGSSQFLTAGWADLEGKTRMTPESHYRVGSTTKTLTAVVALQLVSEGRLRLDDTLGELLPHSGVPAADRMTIEHLLRIRSGLFDFEDDPSLLGNLDAHRVPVSLERAVELGIRQPSLLHRAAEALELSAEAAVIRRKEGTHVLGVEPLGARREADEVCEEHGDDLPLLAPWS